MMLNNVYTAPKMIHTAFRACAKERPLRLAADLAFWIHRVDAPADEACVTEVYQALVRAISVSGIKSDDLLIMLLCLRKYYARLAFARRGDAILEYHHQHQPIHKLLHAAYVSQAMLYDDPLARKAWAQHSGLNFNVFLQDALDFCAVIDYDFYFDEPQLMEAFHELTGPIEKEAIECYRRLAPKPEASRKVSPPISVPGGAQPMDAEPLGSPVPSSPTTSMMVDAMDCAVPCHTPDSPDAVQQRCVLAEHPSAIEQQLVIVKRRKVYHESVYGDVVSAHPVMAPM